MARITDITRLPATTRPRDSTSVTARYTVILDGETIAGVRIGNAPSGEGAKRPNSQTLTLDRAVAEQLWRNLGDDFGFGRS